MSSLRSECQSCYIEAVCYDFVLFYEHVVYVEYEPGGHEEYGGT